MRLSKSKDADFCKIATDHFYKCLCQFSLDIQKLKAVYCALCLPQAFDKTCLGRGAEMGQVFDIVIIISLAFFLVNGALMGLIGGLAGIFSIIAAFWAASAWHGALAPYFGFIADPSWRVIAACLVIFFGVIFVVGIVARILKKIVSYSFVGWLDKLCGAALGLCKGIIFWLVVLIALNYVMPDAAFLKESHAVPYFRSVLSRIQPLLPPDMAGKLHI